MPKNDLRNELLDRLSVVFNKSGGNIQDFNLPQKKQIQLNKVELIV
jgi:hypothetical protein